MRLRGILFLLIFGMAVCCLGQHYPILPVAGSPHDIVTMMQDSRSAIWVGTIDDVYCFDGERFYSMRRFGFPRERVISLAEDSDGGIWIATDSIDSKDGVLRGGLYKYQSGHLERILARGVASIVSVGNDTMFATVSRIAPWEFGDLYIFRKSGTGWSGTAVSLDNAKWLSVDHHGSLLFPCRTGWCELDRNQIARLSQDKVLPLAHGSTGQVNSIRVLRDSSNCIWFRSAREEDYKCPELPQVKLPDTDVGLDTAVQLSEASDGSVVSAGTTLVFGRPGAMQVMKTANGLPGKVTATVATRDGTVYIACGNLFRLMYPLHLEYWTQADGVDNPTSLLRVGKKLYLSQAGISVFDAMSKEWKPWVSESEIGTVKSLIAVPGGTFYAASQVRGVTQLSKSGDVISRSDERLDGAKMAEAAKGSLWFGGTGIRRVVRSGDRLRLVSQGLDDDRSEDIEYDRQRDVLWACYGHSVALLTKGRWSQINAKDGLVDDDCRSVALLQNGDAWVGYGSNSKVSRIRRADSGKITVETFEGKNQDSFSGAAFLQADNHDRLWGGTERALYVATPKALQTGDWLRVLDLSDSPELGGALPNSAFSDGDGSLWYVRGVNVVHFSPPDDFATTFPKPPVFISGITMGSEEPVLADAVTQVPYRTNVTAHIGSLQFDRRSAIHLRYRLLPEQSGWQSASGFDLQMGKLHWGTHRLQVQAQLSTGPWSETAEESIIVLKPLWITGPSIGGYLFAVFSSAFGVRRWRIRRAARAKKKFPELANWRLAALAAEPGQLAGTVIDSRFETGAVLAKGGFATVLEGKDLSHAGRACAIKIFRQELMDKDWLARRFQQEVDALARIDHPNVVRIYGHGATIAGTPYLVMEFVAGKTLREVLEHGSIAPRTAASYLRQTGSALDAIHANDICHRDLKPENLMIRDIAVVGEELVLIDFSIAIVKDPDETMHGLSRAAGTLHYMAPEQAIGYADPSTDIYSLAKVVIEMLTGRRLSELLPNASMDLSERVRELLTGLPVRLTVPSIDLLSSALEFDPARRPREAGSFAGAIADDLERQATVDDPGPC